VLALVFASTLIAAVCGGTPGVVSAPAAALPDALAIRYPNGVSVDGVTLTAVPSGAVIAVQSGAGGAMKSAVESWGKRVRVEARPPKCGGSNVQIDSVDFYPKSNGVVGTPKVVGGIDFGNFTYVGGPGNCTRVTLRDGSATDRMDEYEAYLQDVFAGAVSGVAVAVVVLRCEYHGHGFDSAAQVFSVAGGKASKIGVLGEGAMASADSPFPAWPGGWIHVSFRGGLLYADVWDRDKACSGNADWVSTGYAVRGGKLVALGTLRHHRNGVSMACAGA